MTSILAKAPGAVFTLGVGDLLLPHLSRRLEYRDVEVVFDLRAEPFALHRMDVMPGPLAIHLAHRGIDHVDLSEHIGDRPRDVSVFTQGRIDPERFWARAWAQEGLARLFNAYHEGRRLAILDRDDDLPLAHRARCIGAWLWRQGIDSQHITLFDSTLSHDAIESQLRRLGERLPPKA